MTELETIYPAASARSEDPAFAQRAHEATFALQEGRLATAPCGSTSWRFLWQTFERTMTIWTSILSPGWVRAMRSRIFPHAGADAGQGPGGGKRWRTHFPVAEDGDKKEMPPCILVKSDGATLYDTTDLATLVQRERISIRIRSSTWRIAPEPAF